VGSGRGGVALITLTTDFGTIDPFVGIMKGVIATRAPEVQVVDVSHGIPAGNVLAGALVLKAAAPYFPLRTVHVAVVDPGVGTERRAICIETAEACFVGPDNGLLSLAAPLDRAIRVTEITNPEHMLVPRSHTFHGRDVFAPAAAALATGLPPTSLGPELTEIDYLGLPMPVTDGKTVRGQIIYADVFGNLATNIEATMLPASIDHVEIAGRSIRHFVPTYGTVGTGELLALVNSWGLVEIAQRDGDARSYLRADVGTAVTVVAA
jgi:S-adenosylmethionine hydrolase